MDRLQAGDDAAASAVFQRFARRLIGLARGRLEARLRQKVDPEDVLQSVFKSFFLRCGEGQWQFGGWDDLGSLLARITLHKCHKWSDHFHAEARDLNREAASAASGSGIVGQVFDREPTPSEMLQLAETVEELLRGLEGRDREIATLALQGTPRCPATPLLQAAWLVHKNERGVIMQGFYWRWCCNDIIGPQRTRSRMRRLLIASIPRVEATFSIHR